MSPPLTPPAGGSPCFALAEQLVTSERGFDLDDDAERRAECEAAEAANDLTPWGAWFHGLLLWRAGEWAAAAERFDLAASQGERPLASGWLAALSALRAGDAEDALGRVLALELGAPDPEDVEHGEIERSHLELARGHALRALGRADEAEAAYRASLSRVERPSVRGELGLLLAARGRDEAAVEVLSGAEVLGELPGEGCVTLAALLAPTDPDAAVEALDAYLIHNPAQEAALAANEDLAPLRGHPGFEALVALPPAPSLAWLDRFPALVALRDDESVAALGVCFRGEAEAAEGGAALLKEFTGHFPLGMLWSDALFEACGAAAAGKLLVADTPAVFHRGGYDIPGGLYLDPERPDQLFFLPGPGVPPVFFHELPATAEALAEVLGHYYPPRQYPSRRVPRAELTHHLRLFMGYDDQLVVVHPYSGSLAPIDFHELDRHLVFSPFLDALLWGSASEDDPWPERVPPQPGYGVKIAQRQRELRAQAPGGVCRFTRRALFSRSHVAYELHQQRLWVWDIRYRPSPFPEPIERLNALLGARFPTDLPFDVVGAMLGFEAIPVEDLLTTLGELPDDGPIMAYLSVIAALRHDDPALLTLMRSYLRHRDPNLRAGLANLCITYDFAALLEDLTVMEGDPGLREQLLAVIHQGIAPPLYDEQGEPVDYWDSKAAMAEDEGWDGDDPDEDSSDWEDEA